MAKSIRTFLDQAPQSAPKMSRFTRFFLWTWLIGVGLMLFGRDTLVLGSALIAGRTIWVVYGVYWIWRSGKRRVHPQLRLAIWTVLALLLFEYGMNLASQERLQAPAEPTEEVAVLSYNLFFKNRSPQKSLSVIKESSADVLLLQEVTTKWHQYLLNSFGTSHPYHLEFLNNGTHGFAIYSRYPIEKVELLPKQGGLPFAQVAQVQIKGKPVQIIHAHLASPAIAVENSDRFFPLIHQNYRQRDQQIQDLVTLTKQDADQFDAQLLIGDLNTTPYEPLLRTINQTWVNTFDVAGQGSARNFPHSAHIQPVFPLDYVFVRGKIRPLEVEVIPGGSSDHLALKARVLL